MEILPEPRNVVYGLYCSCHPEAGIRYVGQTSRGIEERMSAHRRPPRPEDRSPVSHWRAKHGPKNIQYVILQVLADREMLDDAEKFWISEMKTLASERRGGLNVKSGGDSSSFTLQSVESRGNTKITMDIAKQMRIEFASSNDPVEKMAQKYGISRAHFYDIIYNVCWHDPDYVYQRRSIEMTPERIESFGELNWDQVREIRRRRDAGESPSTIARDFGIGRPHVAQIASNRRWRDPNYIPKTQQERLSLQSTPRGRASLTEETVRKIRSMKSSGFTHRQIAEATGASVHNIQAIVLGKTWAWLT